MSIFLSSGSTLDTDDPNDSPFSKEISPSSDPNNKAQTLMCFPSFKPDNLQYIPEEPFNDNESLVHINDEVNFYLPKEILLNFDAETQNLRSNPLLIYDRNQGDFRDFNQNDGYLYFWSKNKQSNDHNPLKYVICITIFSESLEELQNSLNGIYKNAKFFKDSGISEQQLCVIVLFDGVNAISPDIRKKVFNKLSQSLQSELLKEAYGSIVNKIDLLSLNFSPLILDELIKTMKEENYPPGETIFKKGEYKNKDLFFIKKGVVEIFVENEIIEKDNKIILQQLNEGSIFGEIAFFSDMMRTASVKSKEYTTLIRFNQNEFKKLIEESNEDKEKYNYIRDQINLYHNYDDLFLKCYSCNQRNHLITECPLIHRKILSEFVLAKYNYSENQKRNIIKRTLKKHKFIIESQVNKFETIKSIFIKESELFEDNSELVDNSESNIIRDMSQNREFTFESIEESSNKHDFKSNLTSSYECISSLNKRKSEKEIKSSKNLSKIKIITLEGKNTHYFFIYLFANILRNQ